MSFFALTPVSQCGSSSNAAPIMNPPMTYDVTLGTPAAQNLVPPFTNLPAHIDEINGAGPAYAWNINTGTWK